MPSADGIGAQKNKAHSAIAKKKMINFFKRSWKWISGAALVILTMFLYIFTRRKKSVEKDPVLEMHDEAINILDDIAEEEHEDIKTALEGDTAEEDLAARLNGRGGPL